VRKKETAKRSWMEIKLFLRKTEEYVEYEEHEESGKIAKLCF
jgi:hypothetical protein